MKAFLTLLASGDTLSRAEAAAALTVIMKGEATPEEIAGFLVGLAARGETLDELVGFCETMRAFAVPVAADPDAIDLCGTGGDLSGTFNISTAAAFVCAGAGVPVVKHGNRSVSSKSGSADVLEALGVKVDLPAAGVEFCVAKTGIGFAYAPLFHPALRFVMPVRRALGVRTFFNIMGPLCNPAAIRRQVVGAFSEPVARQMAGILAATGSVDAITLHAHDGLDEISISGATTLFRVASGEADQTVFRPSDLGVPERPVAALAGGDAETNARIIVDLLRGHQGAPRDVVLLNAAHALYVSGRFETLVEAFDAATESIDAGRAYATLAALAEASHNAPLT